MRKFIVLSVVFCAMFLYTKNVNAQCVPQTFARASVVPATLRPDDFVSVNCDYGGRLDNGLSVSGAGLTKCRYSRYEGTNNIFSCQASLNAGPYSDTRCVLTPGTATNVCAGENSAGVMNILGTEVKYDQGIVLAFNTSYTLSAKVHSVLAKGKGVRVLLICNSDTCTAAAGRNAEIGVIDFPENETAGFVEKSLPISIVGTGDDRHYLVRISVDKGSEAYFDAVSLKNAAGKEMVLNSEFSDTVSRSIATSQPADWGEGDNKMGYYYGSLSANNPPPYVPPVVTSLSPTMGVGTATTVTLSMKIKFQGIPKKPTKAEAINVKIKLAGGGLAAATAYKSVSFTVNDAGEWSGKATFDSISAGTGYRVYVKGPKHIAKKICDTAPTETKAGTYRCSDGKITLVAGDNILDFSKILQFAGDLPEAGGAQNGIIDAYDTTFIRTNLGTTDAAKIAIGDLNMDGGIDTQDYSMILQSLSIKFDEE